jgi:hypothetical protein
MADEILNSFDDISGEEEEGEEVEEVVEEKADKSNETRKITAKNEIENDLAVAELNDSGNDEDVGEEECYDDDGDDEYNEDIADKTDENDSDDGMSDKLFNQVLNELITLKSHAEFKKKKQSKVIPCAKKFLSLSMSQRSKCLTTTVRKNLLHICEFVYKGKFPIDISIDNKRFLKHLLDKRTPKEDVQVGLTEDLRTHAIIREVIDQIENSDGYGTR